MHRGTQRFDSESNMMVYRPQIKRATCGLHTPILYVAILLLFSVLIISSCEEIAPPVEIPPAYVNESINLNLFEYQKLQNDGGHVYIDAGVRGIILYRKTVNDFIAFERNCTFQPLDSCATVEVDNSSFFMIDPCCSSTFDFEGNPTGGPAEWPLKRYRTFLDGFYLKITSDDF